MTAPVAARVIERSAEPAAAPPAGRVSGQAPHAGAAGRPMADRTSLWLLPEHAVDGFAAALGGHRLLTAEERARVARLLGAGARRRFLGARLLCRYALSARTGRPLDGWRFRAGPFGRPEPEPAWDGVRFNLSHTDGLIACVVTQNRACGVDVERAPAGADASTHLIRHLAPDERAELAALGPAARAHRLSELWVLKEAYLKALGTGLTRGLSGFSFAARHAARHAAPYPTAAHAAPATPGAAPSLAGGPIAVHDPHRPATAGAAWSFDLLRPGPQHVLAVAAEGGRPGTVHRIDLAHLPAA